MRYAEVTFGRLLAMRKLSSDCRLIGEIFKVPKPQQLNENTKDLEIFGEYQDNSLQDLTRSSCCSEQTEDQVTNQIYCSVGEYHSKTRNKSISKFYSLNKTKVIDKAIVLKRVIQQIKDKTEYKRLLAA